MRFNKIFIVLLCLFIWSCPISGVEINIGNYDFHLEAWNNQKMLDYQLNVAYYSKDPLKSAVINVKNGIPENSDPPSWLTSGEKSTITDFFFFIKKEEERIKNAYSGKNRYSLTANYCIVYHYPIHISEDIHAGVKIQSSEPAWAWSIKLTPLGGKE